MKKMCSFLLAMSLMVAILPVGVYAADNYVAGKNANPFGGFSLKAQIGEYIYSVDSMGNLSSFNLQTENRDMYLNEPGGIDEFITNGKFIYYQGCEPAGVYRLNISTKEVECILNYRVDKIETSSSDTEMHYIFNGEHCVKVLNDDSDIKEIAVKLNGKK